MEINKSLKGIMKAYKAAKEAEKAAKNAEERAQAYGERWRYLYHDAETARAAAEDAKAAYAVESAALFETIKAAQGKARERVLSLVMVLDELEAIERGLDVPKKYLEGVSVSVDLFAADLPRAYKYTAYSSQFKAVYKGGAWRLESVSREPLCRASKRRFVWFPTETANVILDRYMNGRF